MCLTFSSVNMQTMKHFPLLSLLILGLSTVIPTEAKVRDLLPKPHEVKVSDGGDFLLNRSIRIDDETNCKYLRRVFIENGCTLTKAKGAARVAVEIVAEIPGAFNHRLDGYPDEAYRLVVTADQITIKALHAIGVIRAAQTLQQMAEGWNDGCGKLEGVIISDWPAFKLRGFMHDVGRSFYSPEELKKQIDLLARFKVNTFHWHLTEYTGWRIEVKAYPQLTVADNQIRYPGKYYTQEQARELVAYARERGSP